MQNINKNISDRLNKLMETHNMTQRELAEALGVSQTAVFSWCSGQKTPRMDKVDKIADLFNVKRSYLLGLDNELGQMTDMMQESEQMRVILPYFYAVLTRGIQTPSLWQTLI